MTLATLSPTAPYPLSVWTETTRDIVSRLGQVNCNWGSEDQQLVFSVPPVLLLSSSLIKLHYILRAVHSCGFQNNQVIEFPSTSITWIIVWLIFFHSKIRFIENSLSFFFIEKPLQSVSYLIYFIIFIIFLQLLFQNQINRIFYLSIANRANWSRYVFDDFQNNSSS